MKKTILLVLVLLINCSIAFSISSPANVSPANGATSVSVSVTLDWSSVTGNTGYLYQLDTTPDFDSPLLVDGATAINSSEIYVSGLYFGTTYYWRAAAKSAVDTSLWSATWNFTTATGISNLSPASGNLSQPVSLTLDWATMTGNTGYLYELDTTPDFNSSMLRTGTTTINSSEIYVTDLYFNTKYYWRAAVKNAVDTSDWTATWNFTTANSVFSLSPANGNLNQDVSLTLDWTTMTGNTGYLYELDTTPDFNSSMLRTGTTTINSSEIYVTDLYFNTKYYWRAAVKNAVDTSDWTATWDFTTLSTISNISPSNTATNIPVNPVLDWSSLTGNTGYLCETDTSATFNSALKQEITTSVNVSQTGVSGLLYGTTYYWHAAAKNAADTSSWTTAWSFTTAYELTSAPVLVSPANNSTGIVYPVSANEWSASAGALSYQYQYSVDPSFATGVHSYTTSLLTGSFTGLYPNTVYYWRVRGANANGYSPWSTVWSFTTESADLVPPVLVSPENNAMNIGVDNVVLDWNSVFGASGYVYEITTDINFISGVTTQLISDTYETIIGLANGTQYFWRVKATDGVTESEWSEVWNFTTEYAGLDAPVLVSPANLTTDVDFVSVTLDWNAVENATEYTYEYSVDNTFGSGVVTEMITMTEKTIVALADNTQYFWRVKAGNGTLESAWSEIWNFTTRLDVGKETFQSLPINIYPNPSAGIFIVEGESVNAVDIANISGQLIYSVKTTGSNIVIDLSEFPAGVYFAKIHTDVGTVTRRLIKE